MKEYLHGFIMCQSMFCAIPCPVQLWDENARDRMLPMLPIVGLEIGALWALLGWITGQLGLPALVRGLILGVYPYLATGFLHLDGFMDVTDAVKSCRDLAKRREILKDSHVGSFAVIGLCLLVIAQVALFASVPVGQSSRILLFIPAVSRCGSGGDGASRHVYQSVRFSEKAHLPALVAGWADLPFGGSELCFLRKAGLCGGGMPCGLWLCPLSGLFQPGRHERRHCGLRPDSGRAVGGGSLCPDLGGNYGFDYRRCLSG